MLSAIRQYFRPTPPPRSAPELPAHELDDMPVRPRSSAFSLTEGSSVMMSFTIAMPLPIRKREKAVGCGASDRASTPELLHDIGEYCIGSMEVPCSEDG